MTTIVTDKTVKANTIEINPAFCFVNTFPLDALYESSLDFKMVKILGEKPVGSKVMPTPKMKYSAITCIRRTRDQFTVQKITEDIELAIEEIQDNYRGADLTVKELELINHGTQNTFFFKAVKDDQGVKRMLLKKVNGISHDLVDLEEAIKELVDVFHVSCFFEPARTTSAKMCDSHRKVRV